MGVDGTDAYTEGGDPGECGTGAGCARGDGDVERETGSVATDMGGGEEEMEEK